MSSPRLSLQSHRKPVPGQCSILKKADLGELKVEPAIWSCDTGQRIPCSERCQLIKRWMSNARFANMATITPKRSFSVVTVAKGCPALFSKEFCSLCLEKLDAEIEREARSRIDFVEIFQNTSYFVKVSVFIKATFAFSLLCRFERR